jgi:uncharacterized protein involved in exopolysaccharide biosynthesis
VDEKKVGIGPGAGHGFGSTRDLLSVIFRRKVVVLFIFSVIFAASVVSLSSQKVVYLAEVKIFVTRGSTTLGEHIPRPVLQWWEEMRSEVEIVRSRPVAERAANILAHRPLAGIAEPAKSEVALTPGPTSEEILDNMTVAPIEETDFVRITYRGFDSRSAIAGVNAIADAYLVHRREMKRSQASGFFEDQIEVARTRVDRARAELAAYKTQHGLTDLTRQMQDQVNLRSSLQAEMVGVRSLREAEEQRIAAIEESRRQNPDILVPTEELSNDLNVQSYQRRLAEQMAKLNSLLSTYTAENPKVRAVMRDVEACKASIRQVVEDKVTAKKNEVAAMRAREESLQAEIDAIGRKMETMPEHESRVALMLWELKTATDHLDRLDSKQQEEKLKEATDPRVSNLQILSHAISAKRAGGGAKQKLFMVFSFALALGMALVAAFMVDTLDHTLKFPAEVESALGVPLLASVREVRPLRAPPGVG